SPRKRCRGRRPLLPPAARVDHREPRKVWTVPHTRKRPRTLALRGGLQRTECAANRPPAKRFRLFWRTDPRRGALAPGRAEATTSPGGLPELVRLHHLGGLEAGEDELCDPHSAGDRYRLGPGVPEDDLQLAPVVGIDGGGSIGEGEAVSQRKPRSWPYLALEHRR